MCGIAGLIHWTAETAHTSSVTTDAVDELLKHRGPDGAGRFTAGPPRPGTLVHRRLAILDPAGGRQPMANADGSVQVVFNGEIYNHRALRKELTAAGHSFTTDHSDTEVLVHGWREWGTHLPEKLLGMFAFAVWDRAADSLFLARDRMGQKPLFYYANKEQLAFASTLPALLAWPHIPRRVTTGKLAAYLFHGYMPPPDTIYEDIWQLTPGSWLLAVRSGIQREAFWRPRLNRDAKTGSAADRNQSIVQLIGDAVESQLEADVPIACFLSGGIDSSIIAALMQQDRRKAGGGPICTVSVAFAEAGFDESGHAAQVARHIGSQHQAFKLEPLNGTIDTMDWLMRLTLGQPFADSSILPTYYVANCARTLAPCAISGDGADELFGGYDRYRAVDMLENWPTMTRWVAAMGHRISRRERLARLKRTSRSPDILAGYGCLMEIFPADMLPGGFPGLSGKHGPSNWRMANEQTAAAFRQMMVLDQSHYLPGDVLWKVDSASMACGLEVRSPFLDHRIVEFANNLPDADILNFRRGKLALRRAFGHLLPPEIRRRPKHGFAAPVGQWLAGPLSEDWKAIVCGPDSLTGRMTASGFADSLLTDQQTGARDHTHRMFSLLMLELWWRHFRPTLVTG